MGISLPVFANEADKATTDEVEVFKSAVFAALVKSLNTKRYANSIVDAVTSEDIGKFLIKMLPNRYNV